MSAKLATNDLEAFWMPFTANRQYKKAPRLFVSAEGMHYTTDDGRQRARRHVRTVVRQCRPLPAEDRRGDPQAGRRARFRRHLPDGPPAAPSNAPRSSSTSRPQGFDHVFFTNSGSESVETALKIALAYHRAKGNAVEGPPDRPRARLSRRQFRRHLGRRHRQQPQDGSARCLTGVDHLRHTHDLARNAFTRGEPEHGAELADDLERLVALHDASTIAAVHRRAGRLLDRRADPAQGLSQAARARSAPSTTSC